MPKPVDWSSLVSAQARSGLSIAEFCRRRGIKKESFYYHRGVVGKRESIDSFVPLVVQEKDERFLELLCGELVMRIPASLSSVELKRIIDAVKGVVC